MNEESAATNSHQSLAISQNILNPTILRSCYDLMETRLGGGGDNVSPQPEGLENFEDQLKMKRGEVLFQGPTHHKNQQKNVKLTFQEFVLNWEGGGTF